MMHGEHISTTITKVVIEELEFSQILSVNIRPAFNKEEVGKII
jgi:hypothetical protein